MNSLNSKKDIIPGRILFHSAKFDHSISRLWEAWTSPEKIKEWWGPEGFTTTIHKMDLREGGEWNLTLHGPGGVNFPNRSIYKEIILFRKLVYEHFNPHFLATVQFKEINGISQLEWRMEFDSPEMFETIVKGHKADEGLKQNFNKLGKYLS